MKKALSPSPNKITLLSVPGDAIIDDEISRNKRSREEVSDGKAAENVNSESTPSLQSNAMSFFSVPSGDAIIGDENSRKRLRELKGGLEVAESVVSKPTSSHQSNATSFFSVPPGDSIIDDEMLSTKHPRDDEEPKQSHALEEASDSQKIKRSN